MILALIEKQKKLSSSSGRIDFRFGSILDFKEFVESTEIDLEKYKYAYNYRKGSKLLFRYDNAPDPRARALKSFPHHKHLSGDKMIESGEMTLSDVPEEIEILQGSLEVDT